MSKSDNEIKNIDNNENSGKGENLENLEEIKEIDEVEEIESLDNLEEIKELDNLVKDDSVEESETEESETVETDESTEIEIDEKKERDTVPDLVMLPVKLGREVVADSDNTFGKIGKKKKPDMDSRATVSFEYQHEPKDEVKAPSLIDKIKASAAAREEAKKEAKAKAEEERLAAIAKEEEDRLLAELFDEPNNNVLGEISEEGIEEPDSTSEKDTNMPKKKQAKKPVKKAVKKTTNAVKKLNTKAKSKSKPKKVRKKRNKVWAFFRAILIVFVSIGILAGIAGGGYAAYVISKADTIHPDRIYETLDVSSHIYDQNGDLVDEVYYSENRQIVNYNQLPENLKNAIVAVEDKTFWTHRGFNFRRIIGAVLEKFKGGRISGTSTLTQQLARNVFLPDEKEERTIKRKIIEMYYAYEIEQALTKEDIITAYLNTVYFGYGCYGVDTAARTYFGTTVENLTLEQCAALAAMPQSPDVYALLTSAEGENTTQIREGLYANDTSQDRRNLVLKLMQEQGYITAEEREAATKPIAEFINPGKDSITSKSAFKDYLIVTVKQDLMDTYDLTEEQASKMIYTRGLKIYSTLAPKTQAIITREFADDSNFPTAKDGKEVQAAMVIVEVGTGQIKAMVGSRNASGEMLFNRATSPRQPGSSIKPLTVYSAALQKSYELEKEGKKWKIQDFHYDRQGTLGWGDYVTAGSIVADQKMTINGDEWPKNVTRSYSGIQTFRTALQKSINTCAVKILSQVGVDYSMNMLKNYGITTAIDDTSASTNDLNYAALGLGAMSEGVTPLEMACAYAAFPNGGVRNTPICYTRVEDSNGNVILEGKSETVKVMDEGVAWIMTDVLKSVVSRGIAGNARVSGVDVGGKTGTTDDRYDIWFDGFTPELSAALWIGTDENVRMDSASDVAARTWSKIMGQLSRSKQGSYKSMPSNVVKKNGEYYTSGTEHAFSSGDFGGVTDDNKYIPSIYDRINGWTAEDQEKADKKLEEEAKKKAEEEQKKEEEKKDKNGKKN